MEQDGAGSGPFLDTSNEFAGSDHRSVKLHPLTLEGHKVLTNNHVPFWSIPPLFIHPSYKLRAFNSLERF